MMHGNSLLGTKGHRVLVFGKMMIPRLYFGDILFWGQNFFWFGDLCLDLLWAEDPHKLCIVELPVFVPVESKCFQAISIMAVVSVVVIGLCLCHCVCGQLANWASIVSRFLVKKTFCPHLSTSPIISSTSWSVSLIFPLPVMISLNSSVLSVPEPSLSKTCNATLDLESLAFLQTLNASLRSFSRSSGFPNLQPTASVNLDNSMSTLHQLRP